MFLSTLPIACLSWMLCCFHASMVSQQFSLKGLGDIFCIFIQPFNVSPLYCPCSNRFSKILQNGAYFLDRLLKAKKNLDVWAHAIRTFLPVYAPPKRWNSSSATCGCRDSYDPAQLIKKTNDILRFIFPPFFYPLVLCLVEFAIALPPGRYCPPCGILQEWSKVTLP